MNDDDLFELLEMLSGCEDDIKDLVIGLETKDIKAKGFKLIISIINAVTGKNKDKIIGFLAGLIGKTLEEYKKMPLGTTVLLVMELKDNEDIKKFVDIVKNMISKSEESIETSI